MVFARQKFIIIIFELCLPVFVFDSSHVSIGVWEDDFNDGNLDGWTHPANQVKGKHWDSIWKSQNGVLDVIIHVNPPPPDKPWFDVVADFLQLTAFPISSPTLTVEVTILKVLHTSSFGIALGIPPPPEATEIGVFYVFTRDSVLQLALSPDGVQNEIDGPNAQKDFPPIPLGQPMKIVFESGKFQLFSQNELLLEIVDNKYSKIELVGIYAMGTIREALHKVMDDFVVSGPNIPNLVVNTEGKLTTTWGEIKNGYRRF